MTTAEIIKNLCKQKGITVQALETELGEKRTSIAAATSNMKAEKLYKIAKYFNVSMEYIIGKDDILQPAAPARPITDFEYDLVLAFRKADEVDHATVVRTLKLEEREKGGVRGGGVA